MSKMRSVNAAIADLIIQSTPQEDLQRQDAALNSNKKYAICTAVIWGIMFLENVGFQIYHHDLYKQVIEQYGNDKLVEMLCHDLFFIIMLIIMTAIRYNFGRFDDEKRTPLAPAKISWIFDLMILVAQSLILFYYYPYHFDLLVKIF